MWVDFKDSRAAQTCSKLSIKYTLLRTIIELFWLNFRTRSKLRSLSGPGSASARFTVAHSAQPPAARGRPADYDLLSLRADA